MADTGVDMAKFKSDMDGVCRRTIAEDQAALEKVGVTGTPAFFINGRAITGAQPIERFRAIVDEEITKANAALKRGVKLADYYNTILKSAKKEL